MLASTLSFGLMALTIRLASKTLPTWEIAFFRNAFGLLFLLPMLFGPALSSTRPGREIAATVRTAQLPRYFIRCLIGLLGMFCMFWSLAHLPLGQAISLSYSSPIFVTLFAVWMLGEQVRIRRWLAVAAGFIGVLVIVRPWSDAFSPALLVAVGGAVGSALVAIQIKQLAKIDGANTIVFWTYMFWVPMSLLPALLVWRMPEGEAWRWLLLTGLFGTLGQVLWTRALKIGDVSALTPISFVQLPFVSIAGWLLFDERIDRWTMIGAAVILAATGYIAHREARLARRHASNAPSEGVEPGS
ncbi:DMT family transporter [Lysobacter pythonis]|uniref:DMT family transporter n=2 Tax=Solilutibacter pythonis TaxID=2483112 RepID=A0A3M2HYZ4_9GAMM|nr:DMT family transporter [Lysobacter pythonis]